MVIVYTCSRVARLPFHRMTQSCPFLLGLSLYTVCPSTPLFHGPLTPGKINKYFAVIFIVNIPSELPSQDVKSIRFIAPRSSSHANLPYRVLYRLEESQRKHIDARRTHGAYFASCLEGRTRKVRSLRHGQHFHLVLSERNILTFMEREFAALRSNNLIKVT